jgi:hypothetical protein
MESDTSLLWMVEHPDEWPSPPGLFSFSSLREVEICPRRWALGRARYSRVWDKNGFPQSVNILALEGDVVHKSVEFIVKNLTDQGCTSGQKSVGLIKELGGIKKIVEDRIQFVLSGHKDNPRVDRLLEDFRNKLLSRSSVLERKAKKILRKIQLDPKNLGEVSEGHSPSTSITSRRSLGCGLYPEVSLRASDLGWSGIADLIRISQDTCEIMDFKTGEPKDEHKDQLRGYALLWWRDDERNPSGRIADRLVLSYDKGDIEVPPLGVRDLEIEEQQLRSRIDNARSKLEQHPPGANPATENCKYCSVRPLCEEYWQWAQGENQDPLQSYGYVQLKLVEENGSYSWKAELESCRELTTGKLVMFRVPDPTSLPVELSTGQRVRVLNAHIKEVPGEPDGNIEESILVTATSTSEVFILQD